MSSARDCPESADLYDVHPLDCHRARPLMHAHRTNKRVSSTGYIYPHGMSCVSRKVYAEPLKDIDARWALQQWDDRPVPADEIHRLIVSGQIPLRTWREHEDDLPDGQTFGPAIDGFVKEGGPQRSLVDSLRCFLKRWHENGERVVIVGGSQKFQGVASGRASTMSKAGHKTAQAKRKYRKRRKKIID